MAVIVSDSRYCRRIRHSSYSGCGYYTAVPDDMPHDGFADAGTSGVTPLFILLYKLHIVFLYAGKHTCHIGVARTVP